MKIAPSRPAICDGGGPSATNGSGSTPDQPAPLGDAAALPVASSSPCRVIEVLLPPGSIRAHRLQMPTLVRADPHVLPCGRDRQRADPRDHVGVGDGPPVGVEIGEVLLPLAPAEQVGHADHGDHLVHVHGGAPGHLPVLQHVGTDGHDDQTAESRRDDRAAHRERVRRRRGRGRRPADGPGPRRRDRAADDDVARRDPHP